MIFLKTTALALVLSAGLFIGSSQAATADEIEAPKLTRSVITAEIEGIKAQALAIKQKATAVMAFLVAHDLKATPAQAQIVKKTINTDSVSAILKGFGLNLDSFPDDVASGQVTPSARTSPVTVSGAIAPSTSDDSVAKPATPLQALQSRFDALEAEKGAIETARLAAVNLAADTDAARLAAVQLAADKETALKAAEKEAKEWQDGAQALVDAAVDNSKSGINASPTKLTAAHLGDLRVKLDVPKSGSETAADFTTEEAKASSPKKGASIKNRFSFRGKKEKALLDGDAGSA